MMSNKRTPVLYLDIDGTVRHGYDELGRFVNGPEDVVVFPEAVERMRAWKDAGGKIIGVTNQGGIGLGIVSGDAVRAALEETQRQADDLFDDIRWCDHAPDAGCWCRKPLPGMIYDAVRRIDDTQPVINDDYSTSVDRVRSLFVGDRPEDEECAEAAGVRFMDARDWRDGKGLLDL